MTRIESQQLEGYTSTHVLSEAAHRLMMIEAATLPGWKQTKVKLRLQQQPGLRHIAPSRRAASRRRWSLSCGSGDARLSPVPGRRQFNQARQKVARYEASTARQAAWQFMKSADPRISRLRRFAKAVGVPPADLIDEKKSRSK